jgi:type I restriction-modification system DNA methylase subunit
MPSRRHVTRNVSGPYRKEIVRCLETIARRSGQSLSRVFGDWVHLAAITLSNAWETNDTTREARETRYRDVARRYDRPAIDDFAKAVGMLTLAFAAKPADILGEIFHGLNISNQWNGQFFSPYSLSRLTVGMILEPASIAELLTRRKWISVNDPAVGAGGMLVAAFVHCTEHGVPPDRLVLYGTDVDERCVHMAFVQLSLCGAAAVITHGNSLSGDRYETWVTARAAHLLGRPEVGVATNVTGAQPPTMLGAI